MSKLERSGRSISEGNMAYCARCFSSASFVSRITGPVQPVMRRASLWEMCSITLARDAVFCLESFRERWPSTSRKGFVRPSMLLVRERGEAGSAGTPSTGPDRPACDTRPMVPKLRKRSTEGERRAMLGDAQAAWEILRPAWLLRLWFRSSIVSTAAPEPRASGVKPKRLRPPC